MFKGCVSTINTIIVLTRKQGMSFYIDDTLLLTRKQGMSFYYRENPSIV